MPIGVPPELYKKYESAINEKTNLFTCFDGKKKISLSKINDNYPDCDDGSDEPGTSASMSGEFYCKNEGYIPARISKWQVGDGQCDCCDGSDEAFSHVVCKNTCDQFEKERQDLIAVLSKGYSEGLKKAKEMREKGKAAIEEAKKKTDEIDSQINTLKKKLKQVEKAHIYPTPTPSPTPEPESTPEPEQADEHIDYNAYDDNLEDYSNEKSEYISNDEEPNADEEPIDYHDIGEPQEEPTIEEEPQVDDAPIEPNEPEQTEEPAEQVFYDSEATLYQPPPTESPEPINEENPLPVEEMSPFVRVMKKIWRFTFMIPSDITSGDTITKSEQEKRIKAINDKISSLKDKKKNIGDVTDFDDDDDPVFVQIYKKEFKLEKTTVNFMNKMKLDYENLGNYNRYENDVMYYDGGKYCWQISGSASSELELQCWKENKIISEAQEVKTCNYRVVMATPTVCTESKLKALYNMTLPQLKELKEKIGI